MRNSIQGLHTLFKIFEGYSKKYFDAIILKLESFDSCRQTIRVSLSPFTSINYQI
jgi:hypothetical protein